MEKKLILRSFMERDSINMRERERERTIDILKHMNMKLFKNLQKY